MFLLWLLLCRFSSYYQYNKVPVKTQTPFPGLSAPLGKATNFTCVPARKSFVFPNKAGILKENLLERKSKHESVSG